jgi:hypothetical protein
MEFSGRGGLFAPLPQTMNALRLFWPASVTIFFGVFMATSCATAPAAWDKPDATREDRNRNQWDCRAKARLEADKNLRQQGPSFRSSGFGDSTTFSRDMARFDAGRDERRMFEQCLKLRGYTKKKTDG